MRSRLGRNREGWRRRREGCEGVGGEWVWRCGGDTLVQVCAPDLRHLLGEIETRRRTAGHSHVWIRLNL